MNERTDFQREIDAIFARAEASMEAKHQLLKEKRRRRARTMIVMRSLSIIFLMFVVKYRLVPSTHTWFHPAVTLLLMLVLLNFVLVIYDVKEFRAS
jgi:hypothetical protein